MITLILGIKGLDYFGSAQVSDIKVSIRLITEISTLESGPRMHHHVDLNIPLKALHVQSPLP